jgi:gliding motility-associated-like protein
MYREHLLPKTPFIAKYDANGNYLWAHLISNPNGNGSNDRAVSVAVDQNGNAYVTGDMYDGSLGGFLTRYTAAGTQSWLHVIEGYSDFKTQENVCVDNSGNVYVLDRFDGTEDLDPTAGVDNHTAAGGYDLYIAKFTGSTGAFQWAHPIGNANFESPHDIETDGTYIYITGGFQGTVDFDHGPGTANLAGDPTHRDLFLARYLASDGSYDYADFIGGSGANDYGRDIELDGNNLFMVVQYTSTVDFDFGPGTTNLNAGAGLIGMAIARYNKNTLALDWALQTPYSGGGTTNMCIYDNGPLMLGNYAGTQDFDPGAGTSNLTTSAGTTFAGCLLDANGNFVWAENLAENNSVAYWNDVASNGSSTFYTAGDFSSEVALDPSTATATVTEGAVDDDGYVAAYSTCTPSTDPTSISASANPVCNGSSTTLTVQGGSLGTGANWQWYTGSCGGTSAGSGSSIVVSPSSNTTYFVRAEGTCGTTSCAQVTITVNSNSTAPTGATASSTTICDGASTTLSVQGGSLGTGADWEWYSGSCGGTAVGSGSSLAVSPSTTTTYYVRAEGTCNTTTCQSVTITVNSNSTAPTGATATSTTICNGSSTTLSVQGGALGTAADWEWYTGSCGGTSVGSGATLAVSPTTTTTYFVRAEGTCGNTSCASVTITVNSNSTDPTSITTSQTTICDGDNVLLSVSGGSLGTGADWEWYSGSCGGTSEGNGTSLSVSPSTTTTYYVRAEGSCNTTNCASVTITVNPVPSPSITSSSADLCEGDNLNLTATPTGGTWTVTSGPGTIATDVLTATASGTINLEYSLTQSGCTGTDNQSITVNAQSDGSWTTPGTVCESGGTINLDALVTGDAGGTWSGTGVTGSTFDPTGLNGQTITITYDVGSVCPASVQHDIIVESSVSANWTQPSAICESDSPLDLTTLVTGSAGGSWSGTGVSGSNFDPAGLSGMIAITYSVGSGSCSDVLTQDIEVLTAPVAPTFEASDSTICEGEPITLSGSGSGTVDYNIYDAPTGGNFLGVAPLAAAPSTTTTYYMEAVATNGCGNIGGRIPLTITVNPAPALAVSSDENICAGETVTLSANGTGTISWSTSETSNDIDVSPTVNTIYYATLTDGNGCTATDSILVNVQSSSTVSAVDDAATTDIGVLVNIDVDANDTGDPNTVAVLTGPANGVASVQTDGSIDYLPFNSFSGQDSLTYTICDVFCSSICDTAMVRISIDENDEFTVPGGFSPNGDGINDMFIINGIDNYPNNTLTIYNRWGDIVFTASPYMNDWSGEAEGKRTISGDVVVTGTYFYVLDLGDGSELLNGSIEIKK